MRWVIVVVVVVSTLGGARADSDARSRAARAKLALQIEALATGKLDAFAGMFQDSNNTAAMFPSSRSIAIGRKALRAAAADWAGAGRVTTAATIVGTPTVGQKLDGEASKRSERLVVVSADLEATVRGQRQPVPLRVTSVFSDQLDGANPKALVGVAIFVSQPVEVPDLRSDDGGVESGELDRFLDLFRVPDLLTERFDGAAGDVVIGTGKHEHVAGDDAKKLLGSWHARKLVVIGKPLVVRQLDWTYAMATISWRREGGKPAPLNVLLVGYPECKGSCVGTDMTPHIVALHYGQAR